MNIYGWSESGVNHVLIFEINPRRYLSHYHYLKIGSFLFVCWLINGIIFVVSAYFEKEHNAWPASFVFILVLFLLNPFPILNRNSRYWLIRVFVSI
jgi:ABC-type transport system involved in multi-copper enzyme maturation permease subunit